jgi:PPOX class probable F420-dependent enzyme
MSDDPGARSAALYPNFKPVDFSAAREFVARNHHGVLATYKRDGGIQMSPVTPGLDQSGRLIISSRETAIKVKNLRRDPRAFVCAFSPAFHGEGWVQVNGRAAVISLPEAMDTLIYLSRQAYGERDQWDDFRARMIRERRVIIRVDMESVGPTRRG